MTAQTPHHVPLRGLRSAGRPDVARALRLHSPITEDRIDVEPIGASLRIADLYAGIGGFHLALTSIGAEVVFAAEIDKAARATYAANFPAVEALEAAGTFQSDVSAIDVDDMPDFDVLCAGFPCQPFSDAGMRRGFDDSRGKGFFDLARILQAKHPAAFFLENVRGLLTHDKGRTIRVIDRLLTEELGYSLQRQVVWACDFGLPQLRPRVFMVGFREPDTPFEFPEPIPLTRTMDDIFGGRCDRRIGFTILASGRGKPYGIKRAWDAYLVDGEVRRIGVREALQMQGFPATFTLPDSDRTAMRLLGNSVAVPAVQATATAIARSLAQTESRSQIATGC